MSESVNVLHEIQKRMRAPKDKNNSYGGYVYRNAEGILAAVKPLLPDGFYITLNDEIVEVGGRIYVKATAMLSNGVSYFSCNAYAREPESRKGMDAAQCTGSSSSYARKYALGGLFAVDDSSGDPDATNRHDDDEPTSTASKADSAKVWAAYDNAAKVDKKAAWACIRADLGYAPGGKGEQIRTDKNVNAVADAIKNLGNIKEGSE